MTAPADEQPSRGHPDPHGRHPVQVRVRHYRFHLRVSSDRATVAYWPPDPLVYGALSRGRPELHGLQAPNAGASGPLVAPNPRWAVLLDAAHRSAQSYSKSPKVKA